jgi:hypothetical protein
MAAGFSAVKEMLMDSFAEAFALVQYAACCAVNRDCLMADSFE